MLTAYIHILLHPSLINRIASRSTPFAHHGHCVVLLLIDSHTEIYKKRVEPSITNICCPHSHLVTSFSLHISKEPTSAYSDDAIAKALFM